MKIDLYDIARFFSRVDVAKQTECWFFTGRTDPFGYGNFTVNKTKIGAHRFSYVIFHGPIPKDLLVRHRCDNPSCVNPNHLETGTVHDNVKDRMTRGRSAKGTGNGRSKLKESDIQKILIDPRSSIKVSRDYGVSGSVILNVRNGKSWGHVSGIKHIPTKK